MQVIANVDAKDNYDAALTLENDLATHLTLVVANNSAIARLRPARRESGGDQSYGPEVLFTPQSQPIPNVSGVKVRNAVPGSPSRIIAFLLGPDDPQLTAGIPFVGTLAASGAFTPEAALSRGEASFTWPGGSQGSNALDIAHGLIAPPTAVIATPTLARIGLNFPPVVEVVAYAIDAAHFRLQAFTVDGQVPAAGASTSVNWIAG